MAKSAKPGKDKAPAPRKNRAVRVEDVIGGILDPMFKKRGFASRDLITHWAAIAPAPYDRVSRPDRLRWPRSQAGAEGAVLVVSCVPGHALTLSHETDRIRDAVNRYFGFFLVGSVKLSATPFSPGSDEKPKIEPVMDEQAEKKLAAALEPVTEPELHEALRRLGLGVMSRKR